MLRRVWVQNVHKESTPVNEREKNQDHAGRNPIVMPIQKLLAVRSPGARCWGSPWNEQTPGGCLLVSPTTSPTLKGDTGSTSLCLSESMFHAIWIHFSIYDQGASPLSFQWVSLPQGTLRRRRLVSGKNYFHSTAVDFRLQLILIISLLHHLF